jgi:hypothetical protein
MSVPTSYLTSYKNLPRILGAIQNGQAPKQFTTRYLEGLGFKAAADRLIIGVLKSVGMLTPEGQPTTRYFQYLDQSRSKQVLAQGIREAYGDLFQVNKRAFEVSATEIKNKLKTLTQGQVSDSVLDKMAGTFKALSQQADFTEAPAVSAGVEPLEVPPTTEPAVNSNRREPVQLGGLLYNIQLILPADRDQTVYDALFRSLREHLL